MPNFKNIIDGWGNYFAPNEVSETLANERAKVCEFCPHNKRGILTIFIVDKIKEIEGNYCDLCSCPLSAKVRSKNEKCPLDLW